MPAEPEHGVLAARRTAVRSRRAAVAVLRAALAAGATAGLAAGVGACGSDGSETPAEVADDAPDGTDAPGAPSEGRSAGRVPLPGFEEVLVEVHSPDGTVWRWCLLLAADAAQRARGLMEVQDPTLGGYDGMLFRFESETDGGFWMRNTPMPLSIAYVGSDGQTVSTAAMEPCSDSPDCPTYAPDRSYRWAVEVPAAAGGVERLGLPDGRLVDTGRSCPDPPSTPPSGTD